MTMSQGQCPASKVSLEVFPVNLLHLQALDRIWFLMPGLRLGSPRDLLCLLFLLLSLRIVH